MDGQLEIDILVLSKTSSESESLLEIPLFAQTYFNR